LKLPVHYLDLSDLLLIAERLSGLPAADLQRSSHAHLLEAALLQPSAELGGVERHPRLVDKAAALMAGLVRITGVPREGRSLAWVAMREFLARNGVAWNGEDPSPEAAAFVVDGLNSGELSVSTVASWLDRNLATAPAELAA
jgi:prophage maintenance system killer protein